MVLTQLTGFDAYVLSIIAGLRIHLVSEFFTAITAFGSVTVGAVLIGGLWLYGRRETAFLSAVSATLAGSTTHVLKAVIARARPEAVAELLVYRPDSYAFPSGHATLAFALAVVLANATDRTGARLYVYGVAVLVAVSRVYLGVHYVTDVLAGALVGFVAGLLVLRYRDWLVSLVPLEF